MKRYLRYSGIEFGEGVRWQSYPMRIYRTCRKNDLFHVNSREACPYLFTHHGIWFPKFLRKQLRKRPLD